MPGFGITKRQKNLNLGEFWPAFGGAAAKAVGGFESA
jgi:hypothetical protein